MGSFIIKNQKTHEEIEVHYEDEHGVIDKIEIYSPLMNRDVEINLDKFSTDNPIYFEKLQTQAFLEFRGEGIEQISDEEFEPNPAA